MLACGHHQMIGWRTASNLCRTGRGPKRTRRNNKGCHGLVVAPADTTTSRARSVLHQSSSSNACDRDGRLLRQCGHNSAARLASQHSSWRLSRPEVLEHDDGVPIVSRCKHCVHCRTIALRWYRRLPALRNINQRGRSVYSQRQHHACTACNI